MCREGEAQYIDVMQVDTLCGPTDQHCTRGTWSESCDRWGGASRPLPSAEGAPSGEELSQ